MKITPAARDSPAEADVCTKLFSSIDELIQQISKDIEEINKN